VNKSIIDKIKKLLNLANSDNQNEAELASEKAQKLMIEHNLNMAKVQQTENTFKTQRNGYGLRANPEDTYLHNIVKKFFFVKVLQDLTTREYIFIGTSENIEIAQYVINYLRVTFRTLYKIENEAQDWRGANRKIFYEGLYLGLRHKMEKQREAHEKSLLVIDQKLADYTKKEFNYSTRKPRAKQGEASALANGFEKGQKINVASRLNTQSENSGKPLFLPK
jgi:hypothetical protein